ncbi:MAG: hypothetical protein Q8S73_36930 [Deltaproteobacteria bacterium]|nr:hypothetical protein [Myxococcales bacterium]MDP3219745.1 hypothetical protein [Deltaproteobacteria bacterium]
MSVTTAVLRLTVEGGSAVTSEVRKATTDLKAAQKDIEKASVEAVARIEAAQKAASERARGRRKRDAVETVRDTTQTVNQQGGIYRQGAATVVRTEQLVTRAKLRELARQGDAQKAWVALYVDAHKRATAAFEAEVGKRGSLSTREQRQIESVALTMVAAHERSERRRTAATEREGERRRRARGREAEAFVRGAPAAGGRAALAGAEVFANYGDDLRARRQAREGVDQRAMQIAAGDIGDADSAGALVSATRRVSGETGLDPQGVIDAIGQAQANFSNLATAADRGTYLNEVLPMLGRAAVATGSSLTDMVQAAGEFQRQMGVTNAQLPTALAQAIQGGRLGSISFSDQARHMGAIGGGAARFLSSRPEDSLQSLATTNALFQMAGRAGGGGDVSATRAQAFISNFTSARGQNALRRTLGRNVMGSDGQIITRPGENQSQAFRRTIEEAYARTGGNSTRFLDAVAGSNVRGRALGDQLLRDMRGHGGRLSDFGGIVDQSLQATPEATITRPFQSVSRTPASERARHEVGQFWTESSARTNYAGDTERQRREFARDNPFIARVMDALPGSGAARGLQDTTNLAFQTGESTGAYAGSAPLPANATRAQRQAAVALDLATGQVRQNLGSTAGMADRSSVQPAIEQAGTRELARLQLGDRARASGGNPAAISDEAIERFARANAAALLQALRGAQFTVTPNAGADVHARTTNAGNGGR